MRLVETNTYSKERDYMMPRSRNGNHIEPGRKLNDKAVKNHKNFYGCSGAVLCAFHEPAGLSESEAQRKAAPFSSGGKEGRADAVRFPEAFSVLKK